METVTKEKVTITDVMEKQWEGKIFYNITLADGRTGSSNDSKFKELLAKTVEVDVKPGKVYKGVQQFYFNLPKENGGAGGKKFPVKDYGFEKRKAALECAVTLVNSGKIATNQLEQCRDKFYEYLNTK